MPSYDIAIVAFTAGAPRKWLDNLTAQHSIPGVTRTRRGVKVEFAFDAVVTICLARTLVTELGLPVRRATAMAMEIQQDPRGVIQLPAGISLEVDLESMTRTVQQRLLEAAESVPRVRRGRPRRRSERTEGF